MLFNPLGRGAGGRAVNIGCVGGQLWTDVVSTSGHPAFFHCKPCTSMLVPAVLLSHFLRGVSEGFTMALSPALAEGVTG